MENATPGAGVGRLYFLDNLRTFIVILVILSHISMTFGPIDGWYFYDLHKSQAITYLMYYIVAVNLSFILGILFMIAGYFMPGSIKKKGVVEFWKDRLIKLFIPFLIYVFAVVPVLNYFREYYNAGSAKPVVNFFAFYRDNVFNLHLFGSGPMWFVFLLLVFSLGYTLFSLIATGGSGHAKSFADFPKYKHIIGLIVLLGLTTFAVRLAFPIDHWYNLLGITYIDVSHLPQYIFFFIIGNLAHRHKWLTRIPNNIGKTFLILMVAAIFLWPLLMISGGIMNGVLQPFFGGMYWQAILYSMWEAVISTGALIGVSWLFSIKMNKNGILLERISKNSFNVYLIHAPIIVGIGYLFWGISLPPMVKYVIEIVLGISICFSIPIIFKMLANQIQKGWRLAFSLIKSVLSIFN